MRFFYCIHPRYCKTWVHYHASVRLCPLRVDINIIEARSTCCGEPLCKRPYFSNASRLCENARNANGANITQ